MSLPERNASISYHLTSQPGAGPRVSRGLREIPDLWLPLFAGIPRLLQSTMVARGVCGWYAGTYLFYCPSPHGSFIGLFLVFFLGSPVFSSCSGFSDVLAFFGVFRISADSRFCPRVAASSQLAQPGWKPCHLGCPRVSASRQLAHPGWKPCQLEAGSTTTSPGSSGTSLFRRPAGTALRPEVRRLRYDLFYNFWGPEVDSSGHTGSLPGCAEQGVLCPGGGKVNVQVKQTACRF